MLAHPTPAQAFPTRAQRQAVYFAAHPVWQQWRTTGGVLWNAVSTLDSPGLVLARQIHKAAAWVLDTAFSQAPADVGLWLVLGPVVRASWHQWRIVATQPVTATPTQTLQLSPAAQGALQALRQWDPVLNQRAPASPEAALLAVCQGLAVVPTQNPTATTAPSVRLHTLTDQDTLLTLASQYLGNPELWPTIRALNHLRSPYISPRLWDQYGPPVAAFELTTATSAQPFVAAPVVNAGATTVTLPGVPGPLAQSGTVVVLEQWTSTGRQQEAHPIQSYNPDTFVATLTEAVTASYGVGALMSLNLNPAQLTTQVLAPGQSIQIPLSGQPTSAQLTDPQDPMGTDIYVDEQGFLARTDTGDLMTATGIQNLAGALRRRLDSALGTVPLHPTTYGSGLPSVVGQPMLGTHIITGYVRTALLQDPRVTSVPTVTVQQHGTAWIIVAQCQVRSMPSPIPVTTTFIQAA
ncbi:hypothetical protein [Sulfobacillus harzensis]|uniref:Uncharacterized protein n=1 Tax=Sulfobacillus harzensis TaxID=2729629 RepID=A0A7Y0L0N0_9FIRM|nr:hypothetical protein [Sulfobacillus harzensis]NMP20782.1 hypothetical protein [Sulfobacillus harzensis]